MSSSLSLGDQIRQAVRKATDENRDTDDWDSIVLLCDLLMQRPDEASPIVMKVIIERLQTNNPKIQRLTLTLLDSCVKNTGDYFHGIVCDPKNLAIVEQLAQSEDVGHRVKEVVEEWSREHGVRMPQFHRSLARINGEEPPLKVTAGSHSSRSHAQGEIPAQRTEDEGSRHQDPMQKIRADMQVVRDTAKMLREIVENADSVEDMKDETCVQVVVNCREMHRRLITLVESEPEEELLLELIDLNDELFEAIEEHDHFRRTGKKKETLEKPADKGKERVPDESAAQREENLLDAFTSDEPVATGNVQHAPAPAPPADSLDSFLFGPSAPPPPSSTSPASAEGSVTSVSSSSTPQPASKTSSAAQPLDAGQLHPQDPFADLASVRIPPPQQSQQQQQKQGSNIDPLDPFL